MVGLEIPHESARAARHRDGALHRRSGRPHARTCCTPGRCRRRTPTRTVTELRRRRRRYDGAGRGPGAHRRGRARGQRRRDQARRAAVPDRGRCSTGTRSCWVLGETLEAARLGAEAVEVEYEPLPSLVTVREAIAAESFQGAAAAHGAAATSTPASPRRRTCSSASSSSAARSTSTWRPTPRWRWSTRTARSSSSAAPSTRRRPRRSSRTCSAWHSHEVTVQCLRMGGGFGGKEMQPHGFAAIAALGRDAHRAAGAAAAQPHPGHHHVRQAARVPRQWRVGFDDDGRLLALDATLTADGGWSLDLSEPVLARALCHIDNAYWIPNIGCTAGSPRPTRRPRRRSAASAARRA